VGLRIEKQELLAASDRIGSIVAMSRGYIDLKKLLAIGEHPFLGIFEQYCEDMRFNTRVLEWSCKITPNFFEGARFLHTARYPSFDKARPAVNKLLSSLGVTPETGLFHQLPSLAEAVGEGLAVGYAEDHRSTVPGSELKLYITTSRIDAVRHVIRTLIPAEACCPDNISRVMIAAALDDRRVCRSRIYFLWDHTRLQGLRLANWFNEWCTRDEIELISSSATKTLSISFKAGKRDMIYLSAPFYNPQLNRFIVEKLEKYPLAFAELDNLRWIGFSKFGQGLGSEEVNVYFNTVFA
jgi:hypothetical protein